MSKKLTIEQMKELAKLKGGKCLSKKYINAYAKLKWQCKEGHVWEAIPHNVKIGTWCPFCGGSLKLTIEEMKELAKLKGGKCLSKKYINAKTKLKWQCKEGHVWDTKPSHIQSGHWCPYCAGQGKPTIKDIQNLAKARGGRCLSKKYINYNIKLKWRCKKGHVWETIPYNISKGHWCPKCARKRR